MVQKLQYNANQASLPAEGYVRLPQVLAVIPVSKSAWWAGVKSGRYPRAVKLSAKTTAWKISDIRRLIDDLAKVKEA